MNNRCRLEAFLSRLSTCCIFQGLMSFIDNVVKLNETEKRLRLFICREVLWLRELIAFPSLVLYLIVSDEMCHAAACFNKNKLLVKNELDVCFLRRQGAYWFGLMLWSIPLIPLRATVAQIRHSDGSICLFLPACAIIVTRLHQPIRRWVVNFIGPLCIS